jgi:hypothetical protein
MICQTRAKSGSLLSSFSSTQIISITSFHDPYFQVSTGGTPVRHRARSQGTELTRMGSSMGRWLGGAEAAVLQQQGSSSG